MLGGHVKAVFTIVTVIFIICVSATVTSFREIPIAKLEARPQILPNFLNEDEDTKMEHSNSMPNVADSEETLTMQTTTYGTLEQQDQLSVPKSMVTFFLNPCNP